MLRFILPFLFFFALFILIRKIDGKDLDGTQFIWISLFAATSSIMLGCLNLLGRKKSKNTPNRRN
jgi:hypothetical protein